MYVYVRVFQALPVVRVFQEKMEKQVCKDLLARQERSVVEGSEAFREKED